MTASTLHYIYDPLCGWCYAAGPLVQAILNAGVTIELHGGGLWDAPTRIASDKRTHIRQADARIAELSGVPFGARYLDGLLDDPSLTVWSRPTTAAVLAAGTIERGADVRMLRAIQRALYVDGRHVVEAPVLTVLAEEIGLPDDVFAAAVAATTVDKHIAATRRLMGRANLRGFPGFLLERGGDLVRIDHEPFYGRPSGFADAVVAAAN